VFVRAVVRDRYGGVEVLRVEEIADPTPGPGEVLIRVAASSLNRADRYLLEGRPLPLRFVTGLFRPKRRGLGLDVAGEVVAVGPGAEGAVGDRVFGQQDLGQTWAELVAVPSSNVAPAPANLRAAEAGCVPLAGLTALQGLRDAAKVQPGQSVVVNGATGGVGPFAVQVAVALGADVTAVCAARNVEFVRTLGASRVFAREEVDFTTSVRDADVLFDVAGDRPLAEARCGAPSDGWLGPAGHLLGVLLRAPLVSQRIASFTGSPNRADLLTLKQWIEAGQLRVDVCAAFPLDDVAAAVHRLRTGHPRSKIALTVASGASTAW
jgi:NADPH:quinone reductase-like Zn-dependent oxidoreductase